MLCVKWKTPLGTFFRTKRLGPVDAILVAAALNSRHVDCRVTVLDRDNRAVPVGDLRIDEMFKLYVQDLKWTGPLSC